jgi:hypothetical protein
MESGMTFACSARLLSGRVIGCRAWHLSAPDTVPMSLSMRFHSSRLRGAIFTCLLTCGLALPGAAGAAPRRTVTVPLGATHEVRGTITAVSWSSFTIQTGGRPMSVLSALTNAANVVTQGDYPYVYGGGHEAAGTASIGIKGPGYNGRRIGYDCSGSVAAVLAGAGVWPAGAPVPADNGVVAQLMHDHLIARGAESALAHPREVTLYDKPGVHIFMDIDGRFFGTSDGGGGSPLADGGAGWLDDGAPDAAQHAFKRYHLLASVLASRTTYGPSLTFGVGRDPDLLYGLTAGQPVHVTYTERANGTMTAQAVS